MGPFPDHKSLDVYRFPEKARNSLHYAHCYIPASLAAVLNQQAALVAPIVQSFYYRDPVDLQVRLLCCYSAYTGSTISW